MECANWLIVGRIPDILEGIKKIAVSLLHALLNPAHEGFLLGGFLNLFRGDGLLKNVLVVARDDVEGVSQGAKCLLCPAIPCLCESLNNSALLFKGIYGIGKGIYGIGKAIIFSIGKWIYSTGKRVYSPIELRIGHAG